MTSGPWRNPCPVCGARQPPCEPGCGFHPEDPGLVLTPSADLPACRDEDPAHQAVVAAAYPDPPEYAHPEEPSDG